MKHLLIPVLLASAFVQAQSPSSAFQDEVKQLKNSVAALKKENNKLANQLKGIKNDVRNTSYVLDTLKQRTEAAAVQITSTRSELGLQIKEQEQSAGNRISALDASLSKNKLYWIVAFLAAALLSGLVYVLLGKKLQSNKQDVEAQISTTKKSLEEEGIKLDTKLTEVLETQLKLMETERSTLPYATDKGEADHSLALKVADEIVRINKNLSNMDPGVKGLKQLAASVKRIEDNFAANGYEMPVLLNKPFDPRMKVIVANSVPDENLQDGQEVITKIIKPQVNFKGVMIQSAQVEVSVGQ